MLLVQKQFMRLIVNCCNNPMKKRKSLKISCPNIPLPLVFMTVKLQILCKACLDHMIFWNLMTGTFIHWKICLKSPAFKVTRKILS